MVPLVEALAHLGPEGNGSSAAIATAESTAFRERIARPVELPAEPWPGTATLGAIAVAIAGAAVVLAVLALALWLAGDSAGGNGRAASDESTRPVLELLAKPSTERVPLARTNDAIVLAVGNGGRAALVLDGLAAPPSDKAWEAWVVGPAGDVPTPVAVFDGSEAVVPLSRPVPPGSTVAVTLEAATGVDAPTKPLRLVATRGR
jgi:hypothetical protein